MIIHYFNPFSSGFNQASHQYSTLSVPNRIVAVIAGIVGGVLTPFILFTGAFAFFQLTVTWLKKGDDKTADKISSVVHEQETGIFPKEEEVKPAVNHVRAQYNGRGQVKFPDGRIYVGSFQNGQRFEPQEDEMFTFPNGDYLKGTSVDGIFSGMGKFTDENGDIYEGEFTDGKFTGLGKVIYHIGISYEGDFVDWKPFGKGIMTFQNGTQLEGIFNDGLKTARSFLKLDDGAEVNVRLEDGKIQTEKGC